MSEPVATKPPLSGAKSSAVARDAAAGDITDLSANVPERGPLPTPLRLSSISLLAVAIVIAAIGSGGTMFWVQHAH